MDMTGKTQILLQKTHQKKVLALVLAFACAFTMFAGAAFTDAADINADNADAVELLTALNIIEGYEDGSFQPEGTVTRAEMAKMIFTIRNGGNDDASAYKTVTTSFTDINGHWAAGYIKYLQNTGIVAGKSAYIFDPDSTVTTAEAMKMALVLSGYRADKANLTGTAWQNNTISLATTVGMTKDVFSAVAEGCSRQDAAQILSNTLTEVYAVQWSEVTNSFLNDSKQGLAWGGDPITVGTKWMDLEVHTGILTKGPSSKTNPKGINFETNDGYRVGWSNKITFRDTKIDVSDLFGYEVKVVWDGEHQNEVDGVYGVYKTADNEDTTAMWKDIKNETTGKVKLNDKTWTVDKEVLDGSNRMEVYVNGNDTVLANLTAKSLFKEQATADIVTFIDNNADGNIDAASVQNQNVVKVTYVGNDVLNTSELIGDVVISTGTNDSADFDKYVTNPDLADVTTYEGIAKNDYAKVTYDYYNDKVVYEKIDAIEGKIEATRTNNGTKEIRIDGTWYKAALGYTLPSLVSGDSVEYIAIDNLIYNAKKVDGTWGSKYLATVYSVKRYNAGVNENKIEIGLINRDGDKLVAVLDKYNNVAVTFDQFDGSDYKYKVDLDKSGKVDTATAKLDDIEAALRGTLVTYRQNGSTVSLMPVAAENVAIEGTAPVQYNNFRQFAGYDNMYKFDDTQYAPNDVLKAEIWDETRDPDGDGTPNPAYVSSSARNISDDAIVFVHTTKSGAEDATVLSGKDLKALQKKGTTFFVKDDTYAVGGTSNGVEYIQAMVVNVGANALPTATGKNYAYVLNASETSDENDYRYIELWTPNGLVTAYEESSDYYEFDGGEIITYDVVSTGERTIIKNVDEVAVSGGLNTTWVGHITSDGFYGGSENYIAVNGNEYELANDCIIVNVNTDKKSGIEGDAKAAAREARKDANGNPIDNIVFVAGTDNKIAFILIDGQNNEIKNKADYT